MDDDYSLPGRYDEAHGRYDEAHGTNFYDDLWMGTKTFFFILSIPFLMVLGKFLIVWNTTEFILSTFTCACIIAIILIGGKTNDND